MAHGGLPPSRTHGCRARARGARPRADEPRGRPGGSSAERARAEKMMGKYRDGTMVASYAPSQAHGVGSHGGAGCLPAGLGPAVLGHIAGRGPRGLLLSRQYRLAVRGSGARTGRAPAGRSEPRQRGLRLPGGGRAGPRPRVESRTLEQQKEFVRLFTGFLERGYVAVIGSKASVADGVKIQFLGESVAGDSATVATTLLTRNGSELPVDYSMVRRGDRWAVRDVIIDGVSLVANYRAQFNRILRTVSYADLLARMRTDAPDAPPLTLVAVIS